MSRAKMDCAFAPPLTFVASSPASSTAPGIQDSFSSLQAALPPNVMLVTFVEFDGNIDDNKSTHMLRLGHQYGIDDDPDLSQPVQVDLTALLSKFKVVAAEEMTLSSNQRYNDWVDRRMDWLGSGPLAPSNVDIAHPVVTLGPMEIRTFRLQLEPRSDW